MVNSVSIQIKDDNNYIKLKCKDFKIQEFTPIISKANKKNRYLEARFKKQKEVLENLKLIDDKIIFQKIIKNFLKFGNLKKIMILKAIFIFYMLHQI